ncbi:MAG: S8 family serine peptidase, partial [Crocinitomicaceae bacterium]|nr:S8 family serine peptidase [Crocinitomicaceae bacterium]
VVKSSLNTSHISYPFWGDVAQGIRKPLSSFNRKIDDLFDAFALTFSVAAEYPKTGRTWSAEELKIGLNKHYRIILKENKKFPKALVEQIRLIPHVEEVKTGQIVSAPIPSLSSEQSIGRNQMDFARKMIGLPEAHLKSKGNRAITIAVLDTGIDLKHPELQHCLIEGHDFVDIISNANEFVGDHLGFDTDPSDEVGHGTHVAGIIGAKGSGMSPGVVPNCKIMPIRVLGAMKRGNSRVGAGLVGNINAGIKWAIDNGADVINMSLGIVHEGGGLPHEDVVNYARKKGVTIIAATGNDGQNALYFPSALPHVIAVGAMNRQIDRVAPFSTYGDQVDFVAPGTDIFSTYLDGEYAFSSGTSHAAPFVAGAAALLKSYGLKFGKKISDKQIKYVLKHTSDKQGKRFKDYKTGYGMINLVDAIKLLEYKFNIKQL